MEDLSANIIWCEDMDGWNEKQLTDRMAELDSERAQILLELTESQDRKIKELRENWTDLLIHLDTELSAQEFRKAKLPGIDANPPSTIAELTKDISYFKVLNDHSIYGVFDMVTDDDVSNKHWNCAKCGTQVFSINTINKCFMCNHVNM